MKKKIIALTTVVAVCLALSACAVSGSVGAPGGGCAWVPGHFGEYGVWHRGHCA